MTVTRTAEIERLTKETEIRVALGLEGGEVIAETGVG
ncbi:MAG: imidazoleglycerol-phosphate dehydratase, partial [Solirubrobacterales bacterium]